MALGPVKPDPSKQSRSLAARLKAAREECAPRLAQVSDKLNAGFVEVEQALGALRLGVQASVTIETDDAPDPDYEVLLSFRKYEGAWRLLIEWSHVALTERDSRTPLIKASRELRLRAVGLLPDLVEKLIERSRSEIERVEQGVDMLADLAQQLSEAKS